MRYWLEPRDPSRLLAAVLREFAGPSGALSLEGRLHELPLWAFENATEQPTPPLARHTSEPLLDFLIVPLTPQNVNVAMRTTARPAAVGHASPIVHVQVATGPRIVFGAYDNFHPDCTFSDGLLEAALTRLQHEAIIWRFAPAIG